MSTSDPSPLPPDNGTQSLPPESPRESMARKYLGLRMAHQAMMLQDAQEVLKQNRQATAATHQNNGVPQVDEDMGIHIGDIIQHNAPPQTPAPSPAPAQSSGLSTAAKAAMLGTALLGAGGVGAAVPMVVDALTPEAQVAPAEPGADTDTQYDLRIVE